MAGFYLSEQNNFDKQRQHKEFIAAMNEFIAKGGTLTDDEFFMVIVINLALALTSATRNNQNFSGMKRKGKLVCFILPILRFGSVTGSTGKAS